MGAGFIASMSPVFSNLKGWIFSGQWYENSDLVNLIFFRLPVTQGSLGFPKNPASSAICGDNGLVVIGSQTPGRSESFKPNSIQKNVRHQGNAVWLGYSASMLYLYRPMTSEMAFCWRAISWMVTMPRIFLLSAILTTATC